MISSVITCAGERLNIRCPSGRRITIVSANHGRQRSALCTERPDGSQFVEVECVSRNTLAIVKTHCEGRQECSLATNARTLNYGEDPCRGKPKYANVSYICDEVTGTLVVSCR